MIMNEFAKMIYEQWIRTQEGEDFNWGDEECLTIKVGEKRV